MDRDGSRPSDDELPVALGRLSVGQRAELGRAIAATLSHLLRELASPRLVTGDGEPAVEEGEVLAA